MFCPFALMKNGTKNHFLNLISTLFYVLLKPGGFKKLMLKLFVKKIVVSEIPYKKNGRTAPQFLIADTREFEKEKTRLVDFLTKTQQLGESHFHNKESNSFGPLTKDEWNNMFYKHLDHHLAQFGV